MEITKTDFEATLSVATSAQMQVFEKVQPALQRSVDRAVADLLGCEGEAALETDARLLSVVKDYVCVDALLSVIRQLDLVLTPTGFGVVANNTTSPASKDRVDRLVEQLSLFRERCRCDAVLFLTCVSGWGLSPQAARHLRTVVFDINAASRRVGAELSLADWRDIQQASATADIMLRRLVGHEQMDVLLSNLRTCACSNVELNAVELMRDLVFLLWRKQPGEREQLRQIVNYMENHEDDFSVYMASDEYKTNHYERFQNKRDAAGFCFVG